MTHENISYLYTTADLVVGNPKAKPPIPRKVPLSHEKLRLMVNAGEFPPPIKIGNRNYWRPSDVEAWIDQKAMEAQGVSTND